jgi:hypothetical protein
MSITTYHTYPDLVYCGGRLAATEYSPWNLTPADAVALTIDYEPEAIVLRVCQIRGLAPGGIGV